MTPYFDLTQAQASKGRGQQRRCHATSINVKEDAVAASHAGKVVPTAIIETANGRLRYDSRPLLHNKGCKAGRATIAVAVDLQEETPVRA
jgi:hypothetical protein